MTPLRWLIVFSAVVLALMVFIAIVGTLSKTIDPTAIFAVCGTILSGLIGSIVLRIAADDKNGKSKDDEP